MDSPERLLEQTVLEIQDRHPGLPVLEAVLLAAVYLEICADSRQLARLLETEHALILRALNTLVEANRLQITNRHDRTARLQVSLASDPMEQAAAA
ncbi:hypothetical protein [Aestuariispira ectoiniformans]|uniref:hypothetical protein n=1 Tax=Aestuariispira ectoiniformans TaxID=2775080 RepID=UPI00223B6436|nr:hypothetical protein [Aestuariispira ectoiniformans]